MKKSGANGSPIKFKHVLGASASALAMTMMSSAYAQEVEEIPETTETASSSDTVVVTGSRIRRSEYNLTQPTAIVDSEAYRLRSYTNAIDGVLDIPGVASITPDIAGNVAAASAGVGQNIVSLYNLGSQRTLTLVNGNRFVSSNSASGGAGAPGSQVDVNNIPVGLIDRVEVVKVGGAAVYGADAVAGVVNYILKDDFEGAEFRAAYNHMSDVSVGGSEYAFSGLIGGNIADGRGNVVVSFEYNKTDDIPAYAVPSRNDSWTAQTPIASQRVCEVDGAIVTGASCVTPANGGTWFSGQVRVYPQPRAGILSNSGLISPGSLAVTNVGLGSWTPCSPAGGTGADCTFIQFNPNGDGTVVPYDPGVPTGNSVWSSGGDGLNLIEANSAREGFQRYNFASFANYELTDWLNFSADIFANNFTARNPGYQASYYSSGAFAPGSGAAMQFSTDNPFLTDEARATIEGLIGGEGDFFMHRGWLNLGVRETLNKNSTFAYRLGFDGDFNVGDREFTWEIGYNKGTVDITSNRVDVSPGRFFAALDVVESGGVIDCRFNVEGYPDGFLQSVGVGGAAETESILGSQGACVPFDPFGTPSQEAIDYVTFNAQSQTRNKQEYLAGYVSGSPFDLPAGELGIAAGFEIREEASEYLRAGDLELSGFTDTSIAGDYNTKDLYAEVRAPIISDDWNIPLIRAIDIEGSFRRMDNSRSGTDNAWAAGGNWHVIDMDVIGSISFRGNVAKTVRAPAITELFEPTVQIQSFGNDPCDNRFVNSGPNPSVRRANCLADGIADPDSFVSTAVNASRRGTRGGNLDLGNEKAKIWSVGTVLRPGIAEGLTISADYTEFNIQEAIVAFTLTNIMNACYDSTLPIGDNPFCSMFVRLPDGQLPSQDAFTSGYVNAALRKFKTLEISARYDRELAEYPLVNYVAGDRDLGDLTLSVRLFNVRENTVSNTGFDFLDDAGQFDNPSWRSTAHVLHRFGSLTSFADIRYFGGGIRNVQSTSIYNYIDPNGEPYTRLPSYTTVDMGFGYDIGEAVSLNFRATNVFDWYPSPIEAQAGRWTFGRTFSFGATARF